MKRIQSLAILAFGLFLVSCGDDDDINSEEDIIEDSSSFGELMIDDKLFQPEHHLLLSSFSASEQTTTFQFLLSDDTIQYVNSSGTIRFQTDSDLLRITVISPGESFVPEEYRFNPFDFSLVFFKISSIQFFENGFDNLSVGPRVDETMQISNVDDLYTLEFDSMLFSTDRKVIDGTLEGVFDNVVNTTR
ncbi:hypothetical protein [Ekhidna sp.]